MKDFLLKNPHVACFKGVITCRVRGPFFYINKKPACAKSKISELFRSIFEIFDVLESWMLAPQDGVFGLYIYLLQLKHHCNNQKQQVTGHHLGCQIASYKPRFMQRTLVYWWRIIPKQFPNVSTTFPIDYKRVTMHESMILVSAPGPYGSGMWLPL